MTRLIASLGLLVVGLAGPAAAQTVPDSIGLTGFIHTSSGQPYEGMATLEVRAYTAETGGQQLLTEIFTDEMVVGSRFAVEVGAAPSFPTAAATSVTELFHLFDEIWVTVAVNGNAELPRQRFVSNAFSLRAQQAEIAKMLDCDACIQTSHLVDGTVTAAKLGQTCAENEVLKFAGGVWGCAVDTDTTYAAGDGVDVTGGVVSVLSLGCNAGEILKRNAANDGWQCATDAGALGSVTSLFAGQGVSVSAPAGDVTISLVPAAIGTLGGIRAGTCAGGTEVAIGYDSNGTPVCVNDMDTTYAAAAGGGLALNTAEFAIEDGGVTSAHVADGTLELDDLSATAKASLIAEVVLNRNPGFELGLSSWLDGGGNVAPVIETDLAFVNSGLNAIKLEATAAADVSLVATSEMYPVAPGTPLTVRFSARRVLYQQFAGADPAKLVVSFYDETGTDLAAPLEYLFIDGDEAAYAPYMVSGTVPAGAAWVGISSLGVGDGNIGTIYADDIEIVTTSPDLTDLFVRTSGGAFSGSVDVAGNAVLGDAATDTITFNGVAASGLDMGGNALTNASSVSTGSLAVSGSVTGAGFAAWDQNAANDVTTTTGFSGDVTGNYNATVVGDDSHSHGNGTISDNLSINNGRLYAPAGAGAVGIGTTSPGQPLEDESGTSVLALFKNTNTTTAGYSEVHLENDATDRLIVGSIGTGYTGAEWAGATYIYNTGAGRDMYIKSQDRIDLFTGGIGLANRRVSILANGDVGIGTTAPTTKLQVAGRTTTSELTVSGHLTGAGLNAMNMINICAASNTAQAPSTTYYSYVAWASTTMSCSQACAAANTSTNYGGPVAAGYRFFGSNTVTMSSRIHHYLDVVPGSQPKHCCCRGGDNGTATNCSAGSGPGCMVSPGNTP